MAQRNHSRDTYPHLGNFLALKTFRHRTNIEDVIEKIYALSGRLEMNPRVDISCWGCSVCTVLFVLMRPQHFFGWPNILWLPYSQSICSRWYWLYSDSRGRISQAKPKSEFHFSTHNNWFKEAREKSDQGMLQRLNLDFSVHLWRM